jgi:gas vesicle protein
MINRQHDEGIFLAGLIAGGILGGLAGIVLAPKSGKKLRKELKKKADVLINETSRIIEYAGDTASKIISDAKKKAEELIEEGKDKVVSRSKAAGHTFARGKAIFEEGDLRIRKVF